MLKLATIGWSSYGAPIVALREEKDIVAFDPKQHELDKHGFMVDKTTGQRIGLENPSASSPKDVPYPKWVKVHESHVSRQNAAGGVHVSVPGWPTFDIDRVSGVISVLVKDAEDEARAVAAKA